MAESSSSLFHSPFTRFFMGITSIASIVIFTIMYFWGFVTTVDAAQRSHTWATWAFLPMLIPHMAAAGLGFMMFMRWGSNWVTALAVIAFWGIAALSDAFVMVLYWIIGWNCDVKSGGGNLTGVDEIICSDENDLLIAMWVMVSALFLLSAAGFVTHILDLFAAGKSGSRKPSIIPRGLKSRLRKVFHRKKQNGEDVTEEDIEGAFLGMDDDSDLAAIAARSFRAGSRGTRYFGSVM